MAYQKLQVSNAADVTPSDTVNIPSLSTSPEQRNNGCVLYVGTTGDVRVLTAGGNNVVFKSVAGGTFMPVQVLRVFNINTTATNILALW